MCGGTAKLIVASDGTSSPLCEECAEREVGLAGFAAFERGFHRARNPEGRCPHCQTTAEGVVQTGLAGCPLCFEALPQVWKLFGIVRGHYSVSSME